MKNRFPYRCIIKYVPTRYMTQDRWSLRNQRLVYDFKNGIYSENHMKKFLSICLWLIKDMAVDWTVCFAPCSSEERGLKRFEQLYNYLKEKLPCEIHMDTLVYLGEKYPSYLWGKKEIDNGVIGIEASHVFGKHVILIDDVICTGKTFNKTGNLLMKAGALSVKGLFFSKTVYPEKFPREKFKPRIRSM